MNLHLFIERKPSAIFSDDGRYRYLIKWPTTVNNDRVLLFVGANPSQAGKLGAEGVMRSDPTVSRMRNLARDLDYGWLWVVNVQAYVSTDPTLVPVGHEGVGAQNFCYLHNAFNSADLIVCAWGHLPGKTLSDTTLAHIRLFGKVPHALALAKNGTPRHPRGVPGSARPFQIGVTP